MSKKSKPILKKDGFSSNEIMRSKPNLRNVVFSSNANMSKKVSFSSNANMSKKVSFSSKVVSEDKVLNLAKLDIMHQLKRVTPHLRCTAFGLSATAFGYDTNPEEVAEQEINSRKEVKAERDALRAEVNASGTWVMGTWEMNKNNSLGAWFEKGSTRIFLSCIAIAAAIGLSCTTGGGTKKHRTKKHRTKKHRPKKQ